MYSGSRLITQAERTELDTQLKMATTSNRPLRVRKRDRLLGIHQRKKAALMTSY